MRVPFQAFSNFWSHVKAWNQVFIEQTAIRWNQQTGPLIKEACVRPTPPHSEPWEASGLDFITTLLRTCHRLQQGTAPNGKTITFHTIYTDVQSRNSTLEGVQDRFWRSKGIKYNLICCYLAFLDYMNKGGLYSMLSKLQPPSALITSEMYLRQLFSISIDPLPKRYAK